VVRKLLLIWLALPSICIAFLATALVLGPIPNIIYEYQTLVAGILALASAIVAAILLHQQTRQARHIELDRKEGQREAARTWLSLHLSIILRYAETTGQDLWTLIGASKSGKIPSGTTIPDFLPIPMDSARAVREFAQFATKDEARYIALLFASIQVLDANVRSLKTSTASHYLDNLESHLIYAGEVYARAEALLDYARITTDEFPEGATWGRLRGAMLFMTLTHEPTEGIAAYIKERSGGDLNSYLPNRFETG